MSIEKKFILTVVLVVTILLSVFAAYNYQHIQHEYQQRLHEEINAVGARLQLSLPNLIWDFDNNAINKTVSAELQSENLLAIEIQDASGKSKNREF